MDKMSKDSPVQKQEARWEQTDAGRPAPEIKGPADSGSGSSGQDGEQKPDLTAADIDQRSIADTFRVDQARAQEVNELRAQREAEALQFRQNLLAANQLEEQELRSSDELAAAQERHRRLQAIEQKLAQVGRRRAGHERDSHGR